MINRGQEFEKEEMVIEDFDNAYKAELKKSFLIMNDPSFNFLIEYFIEAMAVNSELINELNPYNIADQEKLMKLICTNKIYKTMIDDFKRIRSLGEAELKTEN